MHNMQAKSWKYMLQTNGNYSNIQKATDKTFKLYNANFKTEYTIYLMECIICNLQYASKNETPFKISLNNHRKDVKDPKAIVADKHFLKKNGHRFKKHARFMRMDRLANTNLDKEISSVLFKVKTFGYKN